MNAQEEQIDMASLVFYLSVLMGARPSLEASTETWEMYGRTLGCIEENARAGLLPIIEASDV